MGAVVTVVSSLCGTDQENCIIETEKREEIASETERQQLVEEVSAERTTRVDSLAFSRSSVYTNTVIFGGTDAQKGSDAVEHRGYEDLDAAYPGFYAGVVKTDNSDNSHEDSDDYYVRSDDSEHYDEHSLAGDCEDSDSYEHSDDDSSVDYMQAANSGDSDGEEEFEDEWVEDFEKDYKDDFDDDFDSHNEEAFVDYATETRRKAISGVLLQLAANGYISDWKLQNALHSRLGQRLKIEKQRNGAWQLHFADGSTAYVGIRASFAEHTTADDVEFFTDFIKRAPSIARSILSASERKPKDDKKMRVKGRFKCDCGRKWTSYQAFIHSQTELPWQGKSQYCAVCHKRGEMKSFEYLEEKKESAERLKKTKPHRYDLCEWCEHWQLEGDHSLMAFFIQPSTLRIALEHEFNVTVTQSHYECSSEMSICLDGDDVACDIHFTAFVNFG